MKNSLHGELLFIYLILILLAEHWLLRVVLILRYVGLIYNDLKSRVSKEKEKLAESRSSVKFEAG